MRLAIPPAWRAFARGDAWTMAALAAGLVGGAWLLSPASTLERIRDKRAQLTPTAPPNATGRAMGYQAVWRETGQVIDPIDALVTRAAVRSHLTPVLRHGALPEYLRAPAPFLVPIRAQDYRAALAQPDVLRAPPTTPGVAITAAEVLSRQRGRLPTSSGASA